MGIITFIIVTISNMRRNAVCYNEFIESIKRLTSANSILSILIEAVKLLHSICFCYCDYEKNHHLLTSRNYDNNDQEKLSINNSHRWYIERYVCKFV